MNRKASGFTLLEVMVALFIVAIALGGAIKVMGNAAQNTARLSNKTFAQWVALNQVTKLNIGNAWPKLGETKGKSKMASQEWVWVQKTIKTKNERIKRVEISVRPANDADDNPYATVVGFLAQP